MNKLSLYLYGIKQPQSIPGVVTRLGSVDFSRYRYYDLSTIYNVVIINEKRI